MFKSRKTSNVQKYSKHLDGARFEPTGPHPRGLNDPFVFFWRLDQRCAGSAFRGERAVSFRPAAPATLAVPMEDSFQTRLLESDLPR